MDLKSYNATTFISFESCFLFYFPENLHVCTMHLVTSRDILEPFTFTLLHFILLPLKEFITVLH